MVNVCEVPQCDRPRKYRTYCETHYGRLRRRGTLDLPTVEDRFWQKVRKTDGCWIWTAAHNKNGYGTFCPSKGTWVRAHRFAYELLVGPIPDGLYIDHLCRTPACVNPAHLEPVTNRENLLRGEGWSGRKARQTACIHGHDFTTENTYLWRGHRLCRRCRSDNERKRVRS